MQIKQMNLVHLGHILGSLAWVTQTMHVNWSRNWLRTDPSTKWMGSELVKVVGLRCGDGIGADSLTGSALLVGVVLLVDAMSEDKEIMD
jgi:hypothetical protein